MARPAGPRPRPPHKPLPPPPPPPPRNKAPEAAPGRARRGSTRRAAWLWTSPPTSGIWASRPGRSISAMVPPLPAALPPEEPFCEPDGHDQGTEKHRYDIGYGYFPGHLHALPTRHGVTVVTAPYVSARLLRLRRWVSTISPPLTPVTVRVCPVSSGLITETDPTFVVAFTELMMAAMKDTHRSRTVALMVPSLLIAEHTGGR